MNEIKIQKIEKDSPLLYYEQMARLHCEEIHAGFLSSLGAGVLAKLYEAISESKWAFIYAGFYDNELVGFICCGINTGKVYKDVLRKAWWHVWFPVVKRMCSYNALQKMIETLIYPRKKCECELPNEEIMNFCVTSRIQRTGVGKRLFAMAMDEYEKMGIKRVRIVTGMKQESAQRFYQSVGALRVCEIEVHKGSKSIVYVYETR